MIYAINSEWFTSRAQKKTSEQLNHQIFRMILATTTEPSVQLILLPISFFSLHVAVKFEQ